MSDLPYPSVDELKIKIREGLEELRKPEPFQEPALGEFMLACQELIGLFGEDPKSASLYLDVVSVLTNRVSYTEGGQPGEGPDTAMAMIMHAGVCGIGETMAKGLAYQLPITLNSNRGYESEEEFFQLAEYLQEHFADSEILTQAAVQAYTDLTSGGGQSPSASTSTPAPS